MSESNTYELQYEDGSRLPLKMARTKGEAIASARAISDMGHRVKLFRSSEVDISGESAS